MSPTPPIPTAPHPPDPSADSAGSTPTTTLINSPLALRPGDRFATFAAFGARLLAHQSADHVCYWRRDSRTLRSALRKTARPIAARLHYYSVRLACVHGGQKFGRRGSGVRQKATMRRDCPAHIALRASKCGQWLEVTAVCNEHNHRCNRLEAAALPQNRTRLGGAQRAEVVEMMRRGLDARAVLEHVHRTTGQAMTAKDLANLRRAAGVPSMQGRREELGSGLEGGDGQSQMLGMAECPSAVDVDPDASMSAQLPDALMADDYYELVDERTIIESDGEDDGEQPQPRITVRLESVVDLPEIEAETEPEPETEHVMQPAMEQLAEPVNEAFVVTAIPDNFDVYIEKEEQHSIIIEDQPEDPTANHMPEALREEPMAVTSRPTVKRYRRIPCAAIRSQRLLRDQIAVLRAKKRKLTEETQILQLIKQQLLSEAVASSAQSSGSLCLE